MQIAGCMELRRRKIQLKVETLFLLCFQKTTTTKKKKSKRRATRWKNESPTCFDIWYGSFFVSSKQLTSLLKRISAAKNLKNSTWLWSCRLVYCFSLSSCISLSLSLSLSLTSQLLRTKPQRKPMPAKSIPLFWSTRSSSSSSVAIVFLLADFGIRFSLIRCPRNAKKLRHLFLCSWIASNDESKTSCFFLFFSITIELTQREENRKAHGHYTSQMHSSISLYPSWVWPSKTSPHSPVDQLKPCNESYAGSFSALLIGLTSTCQLWREEKRWWLTDLYGQVILALCVSIVRQKGKRRSERNRLAYGLGLFLILNIWQTVNNEEWIFFVELVWD